MSARQLAKTYFTENRKMTEGSNTSDISSDPYLLCLVRVLQNTCTKSVYTVLLIILSRRAEFSENFETVV